MTNRPITKRDVNRWLLRNVVVPLMKVVGSILSPTYDLLFGWLDRRLARRNQVRLVRDITEALPFLFNEQKGRIVPNDSIPLPPGFVFVTVAIGEILIRFFRGRGDFEVDLASKDAPGEWHDLSLVLSLLKNLEDLQRGNIRNEWSAASLIEPEMDRLKRAFIGEEGQNLKQRLAKVYAEDRVAMREWEWETNQRLKQSL